MTEKNFTHLHVHTSYSFLDGACKHEELIARAKELNMKAIAITDHNHIGGSYEFQKECRKQDIKPVLGLEAYYTEDVSILNLPVEERNRLGADAALKAQVITQEEYEAFTSKTKSNTKKGIKIKDIKEKIKDYMYDTKQYHIIFLAMNQIGWKNLIKLQSESAEACTFNGRFLCDNKIIKKYNEGLICTTACIANRIARYVNQNQTESAEALLKEWLDIFQDRFYLEIQPLNIIEQIKVNAFYIKMSEKYSIKMIATNDVHYVLKSDHDDHDTLLCIGTGAKKTDFNRLRYSNDFWLRSYDEMIEAFQIQYECGSDVFPKNYMEIIVQALENTNKITDRIDDNIKINSDKPLIPQVKLKDKTPEKYLIERCYRELYKLASQDKYVHENLDVYEARLNEELDVIIPKGFASYLLVVEEYVKWANDNNCPTGPGRGSAAGSLCLYLLGITKIIDPIKYKLLFSRFLTKDRTALPDIDTDFEFYGRDSVIRHLEDYYGAANVAHIGTYTIMGVKSGLKDVGRVLSVDFETMNNISKQLDEIMDKPQPKFKDYDALKDSDNENERKNWERFNKLETDNEEIFRLARKFEGLRRNFGVHASGILAMPMPVNEMIPTRISDGVRVCLYTGPEVEELNCVKLDILGLKTLTIIQSTLKHIDEKMTFEDLYKKVDVNDANLFSMLCQKRTDAVFQLESNMFKGMINDIKPDSLNDIIAITSLGRPGPLSAGMPAMYAKRKNGLEEAAPLLRGMDDILEETFGEIVYQEEIMAIGVKALGFDMNQADSIIRKIFGKKKKDKMEMLRRMMKYGKINKEGPEGWHENASMPWYDPDHEYGKEICGGIKNGYSEKEMDDFWNTIQGFADYLFNKSHAACYSYISLLTAWLKYYYPVEFYASVLSTQDNEEKTKKYIEICENENIKVIVPDINISEEKFTPNPKDKNIYFGLASIKGAGENVINEILKNRPYNSLNDLFEKLPKKIFNKRVALAMAKSGALDAFEENKDRCNIINRIMELRKEKDYEPYPEHYYSNIVCMEFEEEILSTPITYKPWWNTIKAEEKINEEATILTNREQKDKNGRLMAFSTILINGCTIDSVIFSSVYKKYTDLFDEHINPDKKIVVKGTKDDKGKLIISSIKKVDKSDIVQILTPFK